MSANHPLSLGKEERITGKKRVEQLFGGGNSHSLSAFPLRVVYTVQERPEGEASVLMMVSVPKRFFKRAVKRNRIKRQLRECYRRNKTILSERLSDDSGRQLLLAFIWIDNRLHSSATVEQRMVSLLERVTEHL